MKHIFALATALFFSNTLIMVFEIIGSRIIGPFVGTSILVWSSLIGIILFFMSLGNYYGGKIADKVQNTRYLHLLFFYVSIIILVLFFYKNKVLESFYEYTHNINIYTIFISTIFFGPVSFLLGMISPIAMKLAIENLETVGRKVGWLGGVSALGAIIGTLVSGFFLIPSFGINMIIFLMGSISLIVFFLLLLMYYKKVYIYELIGGIILGVLYYITFILG